MTEERRHRITARSPIINTAQIVMPSYFQKATQRHWQGLDNDSTEEDGLAAVEALLDDLEAELRKRAQ